MIAYVPSGEGAPKVCHVVNQAGCLADVKVCGQYATSKTQFAWGIVIITNGFHSGYQDQLSRVKGHLVDMPLDFLEKEKMYEESAAVS